jgi:hypothetical protein
VSRPELNGHACALRMACGGVLYSDERGIRPPLRWLREEPAVLVGAQVADKVIGKAAALLFCHGGVRSVWAETMSEAAAKFLDTQGIPFACDTLVPAILNREGTGLCPMEQKAMAIEDPARAFAIFNGMVL